jgi:hypothetical protein
VRFIIGRPSSVGRRFHSRDDTNVSITQCEIAACAKHAFALRKVYSLEGGVATRWHTLLAFSL